MALSNESSVSAWPKFPSPSLSDAYQAGYVGAKIAICLPTPSSTIPAPYGYGFVYGRLLGYFMWHTCSIVFERRLSRSSRSTHFGEASETRDKRSETMCRNASAAHDYEDWGLGKHTWKTFLREPREPDDCMRRRRSDCSVIGAVVHLR